MRIWWLVLMSRSSSDSATTGLGNSGYQSTGERFEVSTRLCPAAARAQTANGGDDNVVDAEFKEVKKG